jgi:hypothetical protein
VVLAFLHDGSAGWSDSPMTWMWILGLVLLVAGAVCLYIAVRAQRRVHAMMAAETLTVPELEQLRGISDELTSSGGFRKVCEVIGAAAPGPQGLLQAELTGTECVWHGYRVQRRYKHYDRDSDGDTRVTTRTETVAEHSSAPGFTVVRDGHAIGVDHGGRRPDGVEQVADRFEEAQEQRTGGGWLRALGDFVDGDRDETIGFQYTEWALRPGTPLYVLGEVRDTTGELVIGPPADTKDHFVVSTRSEEQLTASARSRQRWLSRIGAGVGVGGLVLVVLGILL